VKLIPAQISILLRPGGSRRNVRFLVWFSVILLLLIAVFTALFHAIMLYEHQEHSWLSGLYWVMVTMSTLGFGDITFKSDIGRFFSVVVLLSGMIFLLILMPFTFIEFFYSPFVKAQHEARAPRAVTQSLRDHVILTHVDDVSLTLIRRLDRYRFPYVLVVPDVEQALALHDVGIKVVVADLNDPAGFLSCGFDRAAMVVATADDFSNTSIAFSARELSAGTLIVTTASSPNSVDVLRLAGANHVMQLGETLGTALARRTIAADAQAHVIGSFGDLRIAEAMVAGTPLAGKTLAESRLRELVGVNVLGLWQRGTFRAATPDVVLTPDSMLVLAGSEEQMASYDGLFCIYHRSHAPSIIIGAGRVGRAVSRVFDEMDLDYRIVDKLPERRTRAEKFICGNAADLEVLERAGLREAPAVIITTREDAVNIYLSIYCRKLRPDIQIVARSNTDGNVVRLHNAGADVVMSYASMGSNILFNLFRRENTLLVAEGLNVFRLPTPKELQDKSIAETEVRSRTGCNIIAVQRGTRQIVNPPPDTVLEASDEIILIGTLATEDAFFSKYDT
jgi:voltage-gated potassium channel